MPLALAGACTNACAISRALYVAVVHNSGAPPRAELARMKEREQLMKRDLATSRIVVLPVAVLGGPAIEYDSAATSAVAAGIRAAPARTPIPLPLERQPNEAVILWSRAIALSDSIRTHPRADADYIMQVDVLGTRDRIGAVHVLVVDGAGRLVYVRLWNSHQEMYQRFNPKSLDDAAAMVAADLGQR
jgi:hypothetical protein